MKLIVKYFLIIVLSSFTCSVYSQQNKIIKKSLTSYFINYKNTEYTSSDKITIEDIKVNSSEKKIEIYVNSGFSSQPFTVSVVQKIYSDVSQLLQMPYNTYSLTIYADGTPIEQLIPINQMVYKDSLRFYNKKMIYGNAWVTPVSLPYTISKGLNGHHLCVWASHGKYYNIGKREWVWQRPNLYCTNEDLFTQTIVVPYLIPMLQNAGAIVYTPRERDWQKNEIIIDNDKPNTNGGYQETNSKYQWYSGGQGFAQLYDVYTDSINAFENGSCRVIEATNDKHHLSKIRWTPLISQSGDYAVYISYKSFPNSISDAVYNVCHEGITTQYRVNQKMGGGIWTYLGTFHFNANQTGNNYIELSNYSNYRGVVSADAIRLGGGMSNIARCDSTMDYMIRSNLPRFLESARYTSQWYGIPRRVYSVKDHDDYGDDINVRPLSANYLSRGSNFLPGDSGLNVPIELSMAIHSDAGFHKDNSIIGTLGIYTSNFNEGVTGAGISRLTSRDLAEIVMGEITDNITKEFGGWTRRQIYDKNYGETREPLVPAIILETLSHQNFADMRNGHDPYFKFVLARAIYKGILKYTSTVHQKEEYVIAPLPIQGLSAQVDPINNDVKLSWEPTLDKTSTSSAPTHYIIYTSTDGNGFDNGLIVSAKETEVKLHILPQKLYRYRVCAVNEGGRSMDSPEVCAYITGPNAPSIMMVDGFTRIAGPLAIDNDTIRGFDMAEDPGVIDVKSPCYCGYQINFGKDGFGKSTSSALGFSGSELEGMLLAGNTHDYSTLYAKDVIASGLQMNISSCVKEAFESLQTKNYQMVNLIFGAQKVDGYSLRNYKTFTPSFQAAITQYAQQGGNILVSGSFIGSDMQSEDEQAFTKSILKYSFGASIKADSTLNLQGMNCAFNLYCQPNEQHYWIRSANIIEPATTNAFSTLLYSSCNHSAAIAYDGTDRRVMAYAFPLECITDEITRRNIISASIQFLLTKKQ